MLHHEVVATAVQSWYPITVVIAAVTLNAKSAWRLLRGWFARMTTPMVPAPLHQPVLTTADLVRIQPEIDRYVTQLAQQGRPWTTLAGLIRELNAMALAGSVHRGALNDVLYRVKLADALLTKPTPANIESARLHLGHAFLNHIGGSDA